MARLGIAVLVIAVVAGGIIAWRAPEITAWQWRLRAGHPEYAAGPFELAPGMRWFDDYYVVAPIGAGAIAIGEPRYGQCNFSYLIVGSRRALLFDTGPGLRAIDALVRALTALPVQALPSHLHFDHVGNLARFSDVGLPDLPFLRRQERNGEFRLGYYQYLGMVEGFHRPTIRVTHWIPLSSDIDLGDRRLTLVNVPGHTPESIVLLDRDANRVYAGDFIYPSEIYAFLPGASLRDYIASSDSVAAALNDESTVYGGHGCDRLPKVEVPVLHRSDVAALATALRTAASTPIGTSHGWYPRVFPVNDRMQLLAKYDWMRP
jgi:hydroxyacylglutathione hydrolase